MSRVDQLQKKYPSIPRDVILKFDVTVQGVRASDDLDKASDWMPGGDCYANRDYDDSLKELASKAPWKVKPGYILRAGDMRFRSGLGSQTRLRSTSPYVIREVSEGQLALYEGEERVKDIFFLRHKRRKSPEPVTSRGTPISRLLSARPTCVQIIASRYCEYFSTGEQCKFCNYNAGYDDARSVGLDHPRTLNLEETIEAYKIRCSEVRLVEGSFVMGGFRKAEQEAKIYLDFVGNLAGAASYKPNFSVHTQAMPRKDLQRLKDAGVDSFAFQIEVMDPKLFPEICPGKAKHAPYERWIEAILDAAEIFGAGKASGKFVPGVTLLSPNGHKTWQEARDYHNEVDRWQIKNGVLPAFVPLWWAPGSVFGDRSNLDKFPPTEFHLEVALTQHEAMLEYGLYEKMDKLAHCALDCSAIVYAGDIGMLTLAEDVGQWLSDAVPDESNWLARFIASVKRPTGTKEVKLRAD